MTTFAHQQRITNRTASIPNTSTTVTLDAPARRITIWTHTGSADLHVNFKNATCTTSHMKIAGGGGSFTYIGEDIDEFTILGSAAQGQYSICAWN